MDKVELTEVVEKMELVSKTPQISADGIFLHVPEINRPALQLTGFYDQFDNDRMQLIGNVEYAYLQTLSADVKRRKYEQLLSSNIPCIVFCRGLEPEQILLEVAIKYGVPIYQSPGPTSDFMAEVIRWLKVRLAPMITIHGVLVDVYGEGVLIMGESGIGKSEAALELIKRGHRLVSDDAVQISKVSDVSLVGSAPDVTRHFIELRGIGIVDVKALFGVQSVKETQTINMVIKLEEWAREKDYDRLGTDEYIEFLGNKVVCNTIPVRPGRNIAVIVETAAINFRQKKMGYDAKEELLKRVQENMMKKIEG
ncbi:MAG: HPr(Ser) kinase/phosphatase [Lachnospiraceae bacterium]|nr:HPr(Ser) kinase/phosphatase [Lachnospiraceae bacterium]